MRKSVKRATSKIAKQAPKKITGFADEQPAGVQ